jgi:hypothetical protein
MDEPRLLYRYYEMCKKENPTIHLETYRIIKETHRGYVIIPNDWFTNEIIISDRMINEFKRFMPKTGKHVIAYFTKEEAIKDFHHKKEKQVKKLQKKLETAQLLLDKSELMMDKYFCYGETTDCSLGGELYINGRLIGEVTEATFSYSNNNLRRT